VRYGWNVLDLVGLDLRLDWGRLRNEDVADQFFDHGGISLSGGLPGPKGTVLNFDLGYAFESEMFPEAEGSIAGQILILRLF
jgi:hypothetical protein